MRRAHRLVAALLVVGTLASACGSDEDEPADTGSGDDAAAVDDAYPVTIEHHFGTIEIESAPERVVSLGYTDQDAIVAFGVQPVGVRYAFGPEDDVFFPWADELAGDAAPEILPREEVNAEQVAALRPDLIMAVTAGLTQEQYDTLSEIAPVVVQPEGYDDFGTPWDVHTLLAGQVFGQEEEAQELVDEVEALFADAKADAAVLEGRTLTLSGPSYDGEYPFHASSDTRTQLLTALGLVVPDELDEIAGDEFYGTVSRERADLLDNDVLAFQSGSPEERAGIEADPVLSGLAAVREGRSLFIEGAEYDAFQFASVLSLPYLLEHLVPKLVALPAPA